MKQTRSSFIECLEARIAPAAAASLPLADLDGSGGFRINSTSSDDLTGTSVSIIGDINGDGFDDIAVSAPGVSNAGAVYVVYGSAAGFPAEMHVNSLTHGAGFTVVGDSADGTFVNFGKSVSAAGDINDDGLDDFVIGAPQFQTHSLRFGAAYVIYGSASGYSDVVEATQIGLSGAAGIQIFGVQTDVGEFGHSVAGAGDVNGDGIDDVLVGAPSDGAGGAAYVILGATGGPGTINIDNGGSRVVKLAGVNGEAAGWSVAGVGDVNGDGRDDVAVGAYLAKAGNGRVYVAYGGALTSQNLESLSATSAGFQIDSTTQGAWLGWSVAAAGDVNGDGRADIVAGAPQGKFAAVVHGKASFPNGVQVESLRGASGFRVLGPSGNINFGISVAGVGDVNGDGRADVAVGSMSSATVPGKVSVLFGGGTHTQPLRIDALTSAQGYFLMGTSVDDDTGRSVSGGGDINGDGFVDIVVGAPTLDIPAGPNETATDSGAAFVVLGSATQGVPSKVATFVDADGDRVRVTLNKGTFLPGNLVFEGSGDGSFLRTVDLSAVQLPKGTTLKITVAPGSEGDGKVDVGHILTNSNLKGITVSGNLFQLTANGGDFLKFGLGKLKADSLGGVVAPSPGLTPTIDIPNGVKSIVVAGDIVNTVLDIGDPGRVDAGQGRGGENPSQSLKSIFVGGMMQGGMLRTTGNVGKMEMEGGMDNADAQLGGGLGKLLLEGLLSGSNFDITGGIGSMKIKRADLENTVFRVGANMDGVIIDGNVTNSFVRVNGRIGVVGIGGDMTGSELTAPKGFGKVLITGDFTGSEIKAGYDRDGNAARSDTKIGKVTIKGDMQASSIVAGVDPDIDMHFGVSDILIADGGSASILSKIASVTVKGSIIQEPGLVHHGIVAEQVGKVKVGGAPMALTGGAHNDNVLIPGTANVRVLEV